MAATAATPAREPRILRLNHLQGGVVMDQARFKVLVCGRRWGKTWTGRTWLLQSAAEHARLWYVAPTYTIAHDIIWRELSECIPPDWYATKPNRTRLEMELKTGALIQLKGADNPDSLRGRGVKRVVVDEYADMPDVWDEILRPALSDTLGEALFIGTPKGYNHFHSLYKRGGDAAYPDWQAWRYPTSSAPHFQTTQGRLELQSIKAITPSHIWRQEYEAEFEARAGMIVGPLWEPSHTVTLDDTALLAQGVLLDTRLAWHVLDDPRWRPPSHANIYGSVDYGYGAPWSFHLTALLHDGHTRTFHERYETRVQDREQAQIIRDDIVRLQRDAKMQTPEWLVCDPSMFNARSEMGMKSIASIYQELLAPIGVRLLKGTAGRPARLSRPNRWLDALRLAPDGMPWWSCTTACPDLIRTVPEVPWDEDDPEVEDDDAESHAYEDMGRYFEARPHKPAAPKVDEYKHLDPLSRRYWQEEDRQEQAKQPRRVTAGALNILR